MNSKSVKKLHDKKYREASGLFLVQGEKNVRELLQSPFRIVHVFATHVFADAYLNPSIPTTIVSDDELRGLSTLESNSAALAVAEQKPEPALAALHTTLTSDTTTLMLDTIRDPGNLGTIIRTADWFGVTHIICSPTTVDVYNPKVISATMGSFTRVTVMYAPLTEALQVLKPHITDVYGCVMDGRNLHDMERIARPRIIIMGSESHGIDKATDALLTHRITIPKKGGAESLNVGIAAGIVLHYFTS